MPIALPVIGTVSYGTAVFGAATETVSIDGRPNYDSSGRTIGTVTWSITLRTIVGVTPPTTTDDTVEALRIQLMKTGQVLRYKDKGFSDAFEINTGVIKDVAYGPKPQRFVWKPVASRHAVEILWTVDVTIPECENAVYQHAIREANFKVDYAIDRNGLTTRTFVGHLIIAINQTGRRLDDHADAYREKFVPEIPTGFRRDHQRFHLSEDKSRLDVTIIDVEWPNVNIPPVGCTDARIRHSIRNRSPRNFCYQHGSISASYTIARGFPMQIALDHFKKVIEDRALDLNRLKVKGPPDRGEENIKKAKPNQIWGVVPLSSSITEVDAYGVKQVDCTYDYAVNTSPTALFAQGMFRPIPGSDWKLWARSMKDILNPRGWAGLKFDKGDDAIIDLCIGGTPTVLKNRRPDPGPTPRPDWPAMTFDPPPPEGSWLDIRIRLKLEPQDRVMRHVPLEPKESRLRSVGSPYKDKRFDAMAAVPRGANPPVLQKLSASMPTLVFEGMAIRAWYDIPVPALVGAFGRRAVPANVPGVDGFELTEAPFVSPVPIRIARWRFHYILADEDVEIPNGIVTSLPGGRPETVPGPEWEPRRDIGVLKAKSGPIR